MFPVNSVSAGRNLDSDRDTEQTLQGSDRVQRRSHVMMTLCGGGEEEEEEEEEGEEEEEEEEEVWSLLTCQCLQQIFD